MVDLEVRHELLQGIQGRPLADVMGEQPPGYLFDQCFRERSLTIFAAPAHRGKTMLMLDMAICLDMEIPLFGRFAPLKGREVFFLGCDAPAWDYGLQSRKLCIGHGIPPQHRSLLNVNGVWRRGCNITDPPVLDWLKQWRKITSTDVLFIDSLRATHDKDENSTKEMKAVMDVLCTMRDNGWTIIIAHHVGKMTEIMQADVHGGRGSTVIGDSADFMYFLNKRNRADARVKVNLAKGRGAADDVDPFTFFDIVPVLSDETVNSRPLYGLRLDASDEDAGAQIIAALTLNSMNRNELGEHLKRACPKLTEKMGELQLYRFTDNRLQELRQLGKVKSIERGVWGLA